MSDESISTNRSIIYDYDVDFDNRRIYLFGGIEDTAISNLIKSIQTFNSDPERKQEPIELHICSEGGSVAWMFAAYDAIRQSSSPIHTIGFGEVCSAAVLLLAAGHIRFASENTWLMHHLIQSGTAGDEREVEAQAEMNRRMAERCDHLLARHSKKTAEQWNRLKKEKGEVWLDAKEMLEWGVIDEVIPSPYKRIKKTYKRNKPAIAAKPKIRKRRSRSKVLELELPIVGDLGPLPKL